MVRLLAASTLASYRLDLRPGHAQGSACKLPIGGPGGLDMSDLNEHGKQLVTDLAERHGFSKNAVEHMLQSVASGQRSQAQFRHSEFGGMGQWSYGGMTMIGDMFNNGLKARVAALCGDLATALAQDDVFQTVDVASGQNDGADQRQSRNAGWPAELGAPASQGAQNDMRYAYFPQSRRLAIAHGETMMIYDTGEHQIYGFGQAQGGWQSLTFNSQLGQLNVIDLQVVPMIEVDADQLSMSEEKASVRTAPHPSFAANPNGSATHDTSANGTPSDLTDEQIFSRIERLAGLRDKGILSEAEFAEKKAELLSRL